MDLRDLVEVSSPLSRPLHFALLELAVLASTVLVFAHALRRYREGDRRHLFQWIAITSYGVQMELIAFNFLENYEHAQFTVQLHHGQLPLYVTGLYGTFLYAGIKLAERLRVHPIAEALIAGLAICLIDVPFDIAGVALGWWRWLDTDPVLAFRWLDVPVTSYYWYLIFGAVAAGLCRVVWPLLERRSFALAASVALFVGTGVIVLGVIAFLPFHAIAALGVEHGTIVAAHIVACGVLALAIRGEGHHRDRAITLAALLVPSATLAIMAWAALRGSLDDAAPRLAWSIAALGGLVVLGSLLPLRRAARATDVQAAAPELPAR
ncbi:hypothetical protein [Sandaracinus amylolyticus]|uniref:DUF7802 domain-containing protein n=1 Tax=Sandaracinus amylolyticus TaxID=927083 RepID=A0A0F6W1K6_9BACT|nr:hypothetical protein [Sandaracinus amylolyticus]AKF05098.1 hypothetical protein DB32_002247 [Sandaracinus amylolyticus]